MSDWTCTNHGFSLTSKSEQLCRDTQRLLLRFNIFSIVRSYFVKYKGEKLKFWTTQITSIPEVAKFLKHIPWEKGMHFDLSKKTNPNVNTVPKKWRTRYGKYLFGHSNKPNFLKKKTMFNTYDISKENLRPVAQALNDTELEYLCTDEIYWDFV